jgi:hypothetical protein
MDIRQELKQLNAMPFTHAHFLSFLHAYKDPNNKIKQLVDKGELIRLKRGLYVAGDLYRNGVPSLELLANHLYGPSYISMDYALSFYGLIPERVYEVTSMTTKLHKEYETPFGRYTYIKSSKCLYPIGITFVQNSDTNSFMIATKEKALCDKLVYTKNLQITSLKSLQAYLEEDLRLDIDALQDFDSEIILACTECSKKTKLLVKLHKLIEKHRENR